MNARLIIRQLAAAALVAGSATPLAAQAAGGTTTVIIVRHAERAAAPAADPVLTEAGSRRATDLAESLRRAGITHVLTTTLQRTRLTAAPIAEALGITPVAIDPRAGNHVAAVADSVRARAGGVILVVGHSNTVPAIVNALGGEAPPICDDEYDNLYVLTLSGSPGTARVIRSRYGQATPVGPGCAPMVPVSK